MSFADWTVSELREHLRTAKVKGVWQMRKPALVAAATKLGTKTEKAEPAKRKTGVKKKKKPAEQKEKKTEIKKEARWRVQIDRGEQVEKNAAALRALFTDCFPKLPFPHVGSTDKVIVSLLDANGQILAFAVVDLKPKDSQGYSLWQGYPKDKLAEDYEWETAKTVDYYFAVICVGSGHRRQGLGQSLITASTDAVLTLHREFFPDLPAILSLHVYGKNAPARALYSKNGFRDVSSTIRINPNTATEDTHIRMQKPL